MKKTELMRLDQFCALTGIPADEIKEKAKSLQSVEIQKRGVGPNFIVLNSYTRKMIAKAGKELDKPKKKFEKKMPNGVTYYGPMGSICQKQHVRDSEY